MRKRVLLKTPKPRRDQRLKFVKMKLISSSIRLDPFNRHHLISAADQFSFGWWDELHQQSIPSNHILAPPPLPLPPDWPKYYHSICLATKKFDVLSTIDNRQSTIYFVSILSFFCVQKIGCFVEWAEPSTAFECVWIELKCNQANIQKLIDPIKLAQQYIREGLSADHTLSVQWLSAVDERYLIIDCQINLD